MHGLGGGSCLPTEVRPLVSWPSICVMLVWARSFSLRGAAFGGMACRKGIVKVKPQPAAGNKANGKAGKAKGSKQANKPKVVKNPPAMVRCTFAPASSMHTNFAALSLAHG